MKTYIRRLTGSAASMAFAIAVSASIPVPAYADDAWGCEVALCLATPGSPTTYAECVSPITKLWSVLASGGSFPTCTAGGFSFNPAGFGGLPIFRETSADGSVSYFYMSADANGNISVEQLTTQDIQIIEAVSREEFHG